MTTTLTNGATALALPNDLQWVDEFDWTEVEETRGYSVSGALLIDRRRRQAGRPITLQGAADFAWSTRGAALTLRDWAQQLQPSLTLLFRGTTYTVAFDHVQQPLQVTPIVDYADPEPTDQVFFTMRLIVVE